MGEAGFVFHLLRFTDLPCYTPQTLNYTPFSLVLPPNPLQRNASQRFRQMESGAFF